MHYSAHTIHLFRLVLYFRRHQYADYQETVHVLFVVVVPNNDDVVSLCLANMAADRK